MPKGVMPWLAQLIDDVGEEVCGAGNVMLPGYRSVPQFAVRETSAE